MGHRLLVAGLASVLAAAVVPVAAGPGNHVGLAPGERPQATAAGPRPTLATFGLCTAPQNADDFASTPVPQVQTRCEYTQTFSARSVDPSYGGATCGGYTVAFGPMGDLKTNMKSVSLTAEWGDTPIASAAACASARIAAVAWGYRCDNDACSEGGWDKIEIQRQTSGTWSSTSQSCTVRLSFGGADSRYNTLNLDVIATQVVNGSTVRKRARGTIEARRGNGQCFSASAPR